MRYGMLIFDEPKKNISRKIIHIDMDAFYASVEIRENPSLADKPVVIAKHPKDTGGRGVVTTANYEARKYGIHSAMSAQKAFELCPKALFVPPDFEQYRVTSTKMHEIFKRYTDKIQPLSLDEAYLDVTTNHINQKSATIIAEKIREDIYSELKLTCSAGVSYNKFLAKLASDYNKPNGITVIPPEKAHDFLIQLPIEEYHGVGEKSVEKMHAIDIFNGQDLYNKEEQELVKHFGKMGHSLYRKVRGIDDSEVKNNREPKSIGKESTFSQNLNSENDIVGALRELSTKVMKNMKKKQKHGKTVVLKIRYEDFQTYTRRRTFPDYIDTEEMLFQIAVSIWEEESQDLSVRLLGITVTGLDSIVFENIPLRLWDT
ncbi:MAG: DNA polymerase IV [Alkalibacterium gilvum]|uniref:DNA polymerase IV n=1 Tax=Alkalibacterium TaxID=99906 RepID=UPI000EF00B9D|nr:DNA polymerase IV [Alkalibacterium sp.]MDN6293255.1 DNA polymerase IV [Alkalibacterium sp.]MDN6294991.1 DNA polymerase IV [Alkalibacterium sp.]MDN6398505.1 DNA polymerase IV [Alkalibacterium sp.]HAJ69901.1 DNA polymerase IV [Alkalibacterium sp.]